MILLLVKLVQVVCIHAHPNDIAQLSFVFLELFAHATLIRIVRLSGEAAPSQGHFLFLHLLFGLLLRNRLTVITVGS